VKLPQWARVTYSANRLRSLDPSLSLFHTMPSLHSLSPSPSLSPFFRSIRPPGCGGEKPHHLESKQKEKKGNEREEEKKNTETTINRC